jgi:hypothetical protein
LVKCKKTPIFSHFLSFIQMQFFKFCHRHASSPPSAHPPLPSDTSATPKKPRQAYSTPLPSTRPSRGKPPRAGRSRAAPANVSHPLCCLSPVDAARHPVSQKKWKKWKKKKIFLVFLQCKTSTERTLCCERTKRRCITKR